MTSLWNLLEEGDKLLFYVASPVSGIVGCGRVTTKFRQTNPLWPDEIRRGTVLWPLRFEYDVEYCLSPQLWQTRCYKEQDLQLITRMVFQCTPINLVNRARSHLGLPPEPVPVRPYAEVSVPDLGPQEPFDHESIKRQIVEIGNIQGFIGEDEYPINGNRLDVVWRRVERSVPTYAFEVQVGGDIYHALAKLKHAYDLWNSHIFLAATLAERPRYEELLAGTFHEIENRIGFLDLSALSELHRRKMSYKELERALGIIR